MVLKRGAPWAGVQVVLKRAAPWSQVQVVSKRGANHQGSKWSKKKRGAPSSVHMVSKEACPLVKS